MMKRVNASDVSESCRSVKGNNSCALKYTSELCIETTVGAPGLPVTAYES